jgi:outer membrane protein insertion porin family
VAEAAVVSSIDVRGNSRVDADTIRNYLGIRPGVNFNNSDIDEAVKRLFATGLFSDVRINQVGSTLVVEVSEYAIVNQVLFQGNRKIKDADLARAIQLRPRSAYSDALLQADVEAIRSAYARIGRDDANVSYQIVELGENRVNVVFTIQEGGRTKIDTISFEGNSAYSDGRLREVISTKQSNVLSFLTRNDIYDEERLRADEELLRRFYYNRGYADFRIISSFAELNEATNEYSIVITIEEGQRYRFGDVSIDSTIDGVDTAALSRLLETRSGAWYSAEDVEKTIIALTESVAGSGYAFAEVTPRGDRNFENQTINVVYTIDQGPRAYVERIEIRGNNRTRDYVIRREFDISEGDAFNQVLITRAKRRLERLDFFAQVNISTSQGSQADQVVRRLHHRQRGRFGLLGRGLDRRAQLPRPRPVDPLLRGGRAQCARLHAVLHGALFPGSPHQRGLRHLSSVAALHELRIGGDGRHDPLRPADHRGADDADRLQSGSRDLRVSLGLRHRRRWCDLTWRVQYLAGAADGD